MATYFVHALLLLCEISHTSTRPTFSELKASKRRQNSSKISTVMDILQRAALPSQHYPPPKDIDTHLRRVLPGRVVILCFFCGFDTQADGGVAAVCGARCFVTTDYSPFLRVIFCFKKSFGDEKLTHTFHLLDSHGSVQFPDSKMTAFQRNTHIQLMIHTLHMRTCTSYWTDQHKDRNQSDGCVWIYG